jgi:hypothetical protein
MLGKVKRVLARWRRADVGEASTALSKASPVVDPPEPSFTDEVGGTRRAPAEWIAARRSARPLYVDIGDEALARARDRFPSAARETVAAADRVVCHEFNLLGSGPFTPRDPGRAGRNGYAPIDWSLDPIRGLRFPEGFALSAWKFDSMRPGNADIKLPWELGRCQHFATLGQAYRLTGADKYAREMVDQIADFMDAHPPGIGVQWTCTMDVGLRAVSWCIGLTLIARSGSVTDSEWLVIYGALFDHGIFIERHLENTYEVTSNHFLSNVLGLHFLGAMLDGLPSAARWRAQCREWLEHEMRVQVLDDGADYESSIPYHRLVAELFLGAARLAEWGRQPLSEAYTAHLRRMIEYLASVQRPDGLMPIVGDADDGRLHILSEYGTWNPQDGRHLLGAAGGVFERPDWIVAAGERGRWEAAWWGFEGADAGASAPPPPVAHFPSAGITVLRNAESYALVTNGCVGTSGFGNHKHNDQLSFEYHVAGAPIVVDAGSYVYTPDPESRNLFRSTGYHNTMSIDGVEQNEMRPEWLFRLFETSHAEHVAVVEQEDLLEYTGRHRGYARLPEPVTHTRHFRLQQRTLTITDLVDGAGTHVLRWHFHLDAHVDVKPIELGIFELRARTVTVRLTAPPGLACDVVPAWQSPSYGVRVPCRALNLETTVRLEPGAPRDYVFTFV